MTLRRSYAEYLSQQYEIPVSTSPLGEGWLEIADTHWMMIKYFHVIEESDKRLLLELT